MPTSRGDAFAITRWRLCAALVLALAAGVAAQQKDSSANPPGTVASSDRLWRDPGDMTALDLTHGAGGKTNAPDATGRFTFVNEDAVASSPKFDVTDAYGVFWKVKLGEEARSETAATRFLWAAGYLVDQDYYLAELTVAGLPVLRRGQEFVSAGGVVRGARMERKPATVTKLGDWDWFDNPFVGDREMNGLRVMMSLLNNWDLKQGNNSVYAVDGERHFVVSDAGATFGNTGNVMTRSKSAPQEYEDSRFQSTTTPAFVDFVLHSRPFFWNAVAVPAYRERARMERITRQIPRADAKWLGQRLAQLTDTQIRDAFCAAGYSAADVDILTRAIRLRIAALEAL
jgi:hypothetical protein